MTRRELFDTFAEAAHGIYGPQEARAVAYLLLEKLYGIRHIDLALDPNAQVSRPGDTQRIVRELSQARPAQYIAGVAEFCGLDLEVAEGVLIPRPETEELVRWITTHAPHGARVLDIGTGSGAIAIALARQIAQSSVTATDISQQALEMARRNAVRHSVGVRFFCADVLAPLPGFDGGTGSPKRCGGGAKPATDRMQAGKTRPHQEGCRPADSSAAGGVSGSEGNCMADSGITLGDRHSPQGVADDTWARTGYDIVVSNPPYIPECGKAQMHSNVLEHEPHIALFVPDDDPLRFYRRIAALARWLLVPGGRLYFEIYEEAGAEVCELLRAEGFADVELRQDLNGRDRMVGCTKP